eukprot:TRINITY_DN22849_c0_g1_i1.p2 TRINITY_DN22849_c0_g1~~TRINITY_DN22849_c0_g1_i1.p2  ORF type:complete len:142 (-),score=3.55 TRINITY_DN22849_c0_g1_i1:379-804(-)
MIRRPPRSTHCISSAASDVYKRQVFRALARPRLALRQGARRLRAPHLRRHLSRLKCLIGILIGSGGGLCTKPTRPHSFKRRAVSHQGQAFPNQKSGICIYLSIYRCLIAKHKMLYAQMQTNALPWHEADTFMRSATASLWR